MYVVYVKKSHIKSFVHKSLSTFLNQYNIQYLYFALDINFYSIYLCLLLHCNCFFLNDTEAPWSYDND